MRWAIRVARVDGGPTRGLLGSRWDTREEAVAALRELRSASWRYRYRLVRLVTKSERLQRELDEAREVLEQERRAHARSCEAFARDMAEARSALGEAWCATGASLAEGIRAKVAVLEQVTLDERQRVHAQVVRATTKERQRIVEALIRCSRDDMPPEVDEMARARRVSLDGRDALTTRTAVREFASILATWVQRGAP